MALISCQDIFERGCSKIYHFQPEAYYKVLVTGSPDLFLEMMLVSFRVTCCHFRCFGSRSQNSLGGCGGSVYMLFHGHGVEMFWDRHQLYIPSTSH